MSNEKKIEVYLDDLVGLVGNTLIAMLVKPDNADDVYSYFSITLALVGSLLDENEVSELNDKVRRALLLVLKDIQK